LIYEACVDRGLALVVTQHAFFNKHSWPRH